MKKIPLRFFLLILSFVILFSSCGFISNQFKYSQTAKEFVNAILKKDYAHAATFFAFEHIRFAGINRDSFQLKLPAFREQLISTFGEHVECSFMTTEKEWATANSDGDQNTVEKRLAANSPKTTVMMQLSNDKEFGVCKFLFDDVSKKVINVEILPEKKPIPSMLTFWLFGLLALCVPVFNIYMIRKVKRSQFKRKWPKYLAIIFLNVPSIAYKAISGWSVGLLSFQFLLGVGFEFSGYLNSSWEVGIPLGGLYILYQLYQGKDKPVSEATDF